LDTCSSKLEHTAIIGAIEEHLDRHGILICDILRACAVKDNDSSSDENYVLSDKRTEYYDEEIKESALRNHVHYILYNGELAGKLLFKKEIWSCKDYQVCRVMTSVKRRITEQTYRNWTVAFEMARIH
jgi:hypothetical protein